MFDIGFLELVLIGVVGLLVLGPERLPVAARTAGLWVGRARRMVGELTREVDRQLKTEELRERLRKEGDELGLEKIQRTVDDALQDAKKYKHMVDKPAKTALNSVMPADKTVADKTASSVSPQSTTDQKTPENTHQSSNPES